MSRVIVEGPLADVNGVRHGQVLIEDGVIAAVGPGLGRPDHVFGDGCLVFAGMCSAEESRPGTEGVYE